MEAIDRIKSGESPVATACDLSCMQILSITKDLHVAKSFSCRAFIVEGLAMCEHRCLSIIVFTDSYQNLTLPSSTGFY